MVCEANGLPARRATATPQPRRSQASEAKWWFHLAVVDARLGTDRRSGARHAPGDRTESQPTRPRSGASGCGCSIRIRLEGAERAFNRATEIDPSDRAGWVGLARVYLQRDEASAPPGCSSGWSQPVPSDGYTLQLLGTAYRRLGRERPSGVGPAGWREGRTAVERRLDQRDAGVPPRLRRAVEGCDAAYIAAGQFPRGDRDPGAASPRPAR